MKTIACAFALILLGAANLAAHYTYILPQDFRVASGETVVVGFHNGDGLRESTAILACRTRREVVGKTDAQGRVTVPASKGRWRLHTIHMERASATSTGRASGGR